MAVGYRSVLRLSESEDAVRVAREQFRSWLVSMVRDPRKTLRSAAWDGPGTYTLGPDSTLTVVEQEDVDGHLSRLLLEYVETNRHGIWTTRLYAMSSPRARRLRQVLWFESEGVGKNGRHAQPGTPKVVRNTLQAVDAFDGAVPVLSEPRRLRVPEVDDLVAYITDEHRDLSVVVAAPVPGVSPDKWARAVATLTRDAVGCASFFVLDAESLATLNERIGPAHSVPIGSLRTFVPGVDFGDWVDARRHRILTSRTMSEGLGQNLRFSERLVKAVATGPRLNLLEADLPSELVRTARVLQRELIRPIEITKPSLDEIVKETPAPAEHSDFEPSWLQKLKTVVKRIAGRDDVDEAALQVIAEKFEQQETIAKSALQNASKLQGERERLEDQVVELRKQLEAEQFERTLADLARRDAEKKTRSLERWRAERPDRFSYVEEAENSWESEPGSVTEIIERLTDRERFSYVLDYIELTDVSKAIDRADQIDAVDPNGTYAAAFWEYILVLRDYAVECLESNFSGNLHMYLGSSTVVGRKCPIQRHRPNESDSVQNNSRMRRERTFPVPTYVEASGKIFMAAHFAPTHRDQNAPRMYYYADLENTRKIYIGYIGTHLTNTRTN